MRMGTWQLSGVEGEDVVARQLAAARMEQVILHESTNMTDIDGFLLMGNGVLPDLTHHPLLQAIRLQCERGKPVLGIGLGAELLVAQGWVPGLENNKPAIRLIDQPEFDNNSAKSFMRLSRQYQRNAFTKRTTLEDIYPVSSLGVSKSFAMSNVLFDEIQHQGLNVWLYCAAESEALEAEIEQVAAIANKRGNVLAMVTACLSDEMGAAIFASMQDYIEKGLFLDVAPLNYYPR